MTQYSHRVEQEKIAKIESDKKNLLDRKQMFIQTVGNCCCIDCSCE
jgi:hypothetical protein